ncbi:P-selectin [Octopus bimaculoides]|nr:P-selectin [Octopus bimaculoides]
MIFKILYFLLIIILVVKSENIINNAMKNILLDYNISTSTENFSPWFFKQMVDILNCDSLPKLNNSQIQFVLKWNEEKIYLEQTCDRYFEASQKNTTDIVCLNGKWRYEDKKCKLITCPTFHKPAHSNMTNVSYTYKSVIYFSCFPGYFLQGNRSIRCEETKQWSSPPPVCKLVTCIPPHTPKHANVSTTKEVEVNKTIHFNCLEPYSLKGKSVLTCLEDGDWSFPTPVCTWKCLVPKIAGRVTTLLQNKVLKPKTLIRSGKKVLYSCKQPFLPVAFGVIQCFSGKWHPDIQCKKTCKIERVKKLNYTLSHNFTVIEYYCPAGETLLGDSKRTCLENGTWSSKLPVCVKKCHLLPNLGIYSYRNSDNLQYLPFGSSVPENTNITYSCQQNYSKKTKNVRCSDGTLTPVPHCSDKRFYVESKNLRFKNQSTYYVCKDNYSCNFFGYRDYGSCVRTSCSYNKCVSISVDKASKLYIKAYHDYCCIIRCHEN